MRVVAAIGASNRRSPRAVKSLVVGLTISLHILGLYAVSPVVGVTDDQFGRLPVIAAGMVVLPVAAP